MIKPYQMETLERSSATTPMADRKRNSNRRTALKSSNSRKQKPVVKNANSPESANVDPETLESSTKENRAQTSENRRDSAFVKNTQVMAAQEVLPAKNAKNQPTKDLKTQQKKASPRSRRDSKGIPRWRTNPVGRFIYDAYYELRYKVTWPTLKEARNMTMVVVALSAIVGGVIALADYGLHELFIYIVTKSWSP
jgi:preprotein translocase SecE subunit